jgi:hypothetical protein
MDVITTSGSRRPEQAVRCSPQSVLGSKQAEIQIIGCDLHARQQTLAMLDTATGEVVHKALPHEGESVRESYSTLSSPMRVGIEVT